MIPDLDDPKSLILASVALGFIREDVEDQPTHYQLAAIGGPLLVRWPDGRWFEVSVRETEEPKEVK